MRYLALVALLAFLVVPFTVGCQKETPKPATPKTAGEKAGAAVEKAGEKVGAAVETAGEKTGEALEKAGEKTGEVVEKAVDAVTPAPAPADAPK